MSRTSANGLICTCWRLPAVASERPQNTRTCFALQASSSRGSCRQSPARASLRPNSHSDHQNNMLFPAPSECAGRKVQAMALEVEDLRSDSPLVVVLGELISGCLQILPVAAFLPQPHHPGQWSVDYGRRPRVNSRVVCSRPPCNGQDHDDGEGRKTLDTP